LTCGPFELKQSASVVHDRPVVPSKPGPPGTRPPPLSIGGPGTLGAASGRALGPASGPASTCGAEPSLDEHPMQTPNPVPAALQACAPVVPPGHAHAICWPGAHARKGGVSTAAASAAPKLPPGVAPLQLKHAIVAPRPIAAKTAVPGATTERVALSPIFGLRLTWPGAGVKRRRPRRRWRPQASRSRPPNAMRKGIRPARAARFSPPETIPQYPECRAGGPSAHRRLGGDAKSGTSAVCANTTSRSTDRREPASCRGPGSW
jgi:hypothetical protein